MQHTAAVPASQRPNRDTTLRRRVSPLDASRVDERRLLKGRIVRFEDGAPIPGAKVELDGVEASADADGAFCLPLTTDSPNTTFRAAAPGYFACIETLNLSCLGSGGMLSRVFRLVQDDSATTETHRLELAQDAAGASGQGNEALLSIGELQPLGTLLDQLLAGPSSKTGHLPTRGPGVEGFELALEHGISSLFDARSEEDDPWRFDDDDDDLLIFDDEEIDEEGDGLDDEERILFGDDSDDWSTDDVEYSVDWE